MVFLQPIGNKAACCTYGVTKMCFVAYSCVKDILNGTSFVYKLDISLNDDF